MALTLLEPIIVNTAANFSFANVSVTSNLSVGNVKTDNLLYSNGSPYLFTSNAGGSNTQIQFNDANSFAGSANLTFNKSTNTLSVTNITANGAGLTSLVGANVTGTVANATYATTSGTVTTAAQPNITSVGLLTSLSVGPNSSITLTGTSGYVKANSIQGTDGVNAVYPGYDGVTGAVGITGNLTIGIGAAGHITANGNVTANYFIGNGSSLSGIAGGNVTGQIANALVAGTVYTNAQPNITSVGTLTSLVSSGTANVQLLNVTNSSGDEGGEILLAKPQSNTTLAGTGVTIDIWQNRLRFFEQGGTARGAYIDITAAAAGVGTNLLSGSGTLSTITNGTSNVNIPAANGNINLSVAGNANILVVTGTGINVAGTLNTTGNATVGNLSTTTAVITTGNISTVNSGLLQNGNSNIGITANGNVTINAVGGTRITATSTGANITGTLGVSGNANIGNLGVAQVLATANVTTPVLISNVATGTAPLTVTSTTRVSNLNVAYANVADNINVTAPGTGTGYVVFANTTTGNVAEWTSSGITSNLANNSITATTFVGALSGAATTAGTVTTNAQPNITSVGTLTSLNISGFGTFGSTQDKLTTITSASGIVTHNLLNGAIFYHTTPTANFTANFTNVPTTNDFSTVAVLFIQQQATPYLPVASSNIQIDGSNISIKWSGATVPVGTVNGIDMVSFSLIRVDSTWVVLGQAGSFS